jgi:hypothetical protein
MLGHLVVFDAFPHGPIDAADISAMPLLGVMPDEDRLAKGDIVSDCAGLVELTLGLAAPGLRPLSTSIQLPFQSFSACHSSLSLLICFQGS